LLIKVVRQAQVGSPAPGLLGQIPVPHRLAEIVVAKGEEPGPVHQGVLRGQEKGRPDGPGQGLAVLTQQIQEFALGQAPPGRGEEGHGLSHQARPVPLVIRLIAGQDVLIEVFPPGGRQVMVQPRF